MSGKTVKLSSFAVASDHDDHDCLYKIFDRQKTSIFYSFIFLLSCKDIKIIFSELSRGLANPRSPKNARRGLTNPRYSRRFPKRSRGIAKSPPFTTFPKRSRGLPNHRLSRPSQNARGGLPNPPPFMTVRICQSEPGNLWQFCGSQKMLAGMVRVFFQKNLSSTDLSFTMSVKVGNFNYSGEGFLQKVGSATLHPPYIFMNLR